jgi:hypothetical protein
MKAFAIVIFALILAASCKNPKQQNGDQAGEDIPTSDWIVLFDGSNTNNFRGFHEDHFPDSGWHVQDNELINDGSGPNLITKEQYADFILEWEWRLMDKGGNSGVKYFVKENPDKEGTYALGIEYQMLDDVSHPLILEGKIKPDDYHTTGAVYELFPPTGNKKLKPLGQFNTSKIVSDGKHVEHWLNGEKVAEYERGGQAFLENKAQSKFKDRPEFGLHKEGHIVLQNHNTPVGFRNIRIKIL